MRAHHYKIMGALLVLVMSAHLISLLFVVVSSGPEFVESYGHYELRVSVGHDAYILYRTESGSSPSLVARVSRLQPVS